MPGQGSFVRPLVESAETFLGYVVGCLRERRRRDLTTYIVPRFGAYRIRRMPAEEIDKWLLDEIDGGLVPSSVQIRWVWLKTVYSTGKAPSR